MVPAVFGDPDTQSDVATAFTEQPEALRDNVSQAGEVSSSSVTSGGDAPSILSGISADETTQLPAEQLQEAVDLLKKRRSNPKGLVRRRPSSSLNLKGIKKKGPHTPTPSGSTGLNLRTLPPPPQAPRPPIWALVTMGVAIAVISVSVAALVITGGQKNQDSENVHQDKQAQVTAATQDKPVKKKRAASERSVEKAEESKVTSSKTAPEPVLEPVVEEPVVQEVVTAGSLVGEELAKLEIMKPAEAVEKPVSVESVKGTIVPSPVVDRKPVEKVKEKPSPKVVIPTKPIEKAKAFNAGKKDIKTPKKTVPKKKKPKKRPNPKGWTF